MDDFVTYEIAKKLKAKGMGNDGNYGYNDKGEICVPVYNLDEDQVKAMCPCPQIHEVLKWLREKKHTYIYVDVCRAGWFFEVKCLRSLYMINTTFFDKHKSYEQAAIAGIEYVLDNLI